MLKSFETIAPHLKFKKKTVLIDNLGAKIHYRWTFLLLLACTVLVTSRQYIGEHIRCMTGGSPTIPEHVINTFCFSTTTFTVVRHLNESMLKSGYVPHPGVGPMYKEEPVQYHGYYQWVPFFLFAQAIMFYIPHTIWKSFEGGKINTLVSGLQIVSLSKYIAHKDDLSLQNKNSLFSRSKISARVTVMKLEFLRHMEANKYWALKFVLVEIAYALNVLLQILFTNLFIRGQFIRLGIDFMRDDFKGVMDALDIVFPKVTKCHFFKYGASGSIQKHDALCVMALNVINEKIFTFLWFWYSFLVIVSAISLTWRLLTIILHSKSIRFNGVVISLSNPGRVRPVDMGIITKHLNFNAWLFLHYLAINLEPFVFRDLLGELITELRKKFGFEDNSSSKTQSIVTHSLKSSELHRLNYNDDDDDDDDADDADHYADELQTKDELHVPHQIHIADEFLSKENLQILNELHIKHK